MNNMQLLSDLENVVTVRNDGLLENKYTGLLYQRISRNEVMPLTSPINGAYLIPNKDGTFHTDYDDITYLLGNNNNIIPQIDPYNRGELQNINGKLISKYTGAEFTYDENRSAYIPHYIPDDSNEPAHIEGEYLIGDNTGRKFLIDNDGTILTPQEEYFRERKKQETERFKQMEQDGTLEEHFSKSNKHIPTVEKTPLQKYLEDIKKHPENVTENDLKNLAILMEQGELPDSIMQELEIKYSPKETIRTTIKDFLESISTEQTLSDYLINLGFPETVINSLHQINDNFFENQFHTDKNATIQIKSKEECISISISTTPSTPLSTEITLYRNGNISITKFYHEPLLVGKVRTGNSENFSARVDRHGNLIILESNYRLQLHSKEECSFQASAERRESILLSNGILKKGDKKNATAICYLSNEQDLEPISSTNEVDSIAMDNAYKQMATLRRLGFQESLFYKEKVAGLSYDLNGIETYLDSEFEEIKKDEISTIPSYK